MRGLKNSLVAKSMSKVAIVVAACAGALAATNASAAVLLGVGPGADRTDFAGQLGIVFTVGATPLTVYQLGMYDAGAAGFVDSHPVQIYVRTGETTGDLVTGAEVIIDSTTPGNAGGYAFVALASPITLGAGTTYVLQAHYPAIDPLTPGDNGSPYRTTRDAFRDLTNDSALFSNLVSAYAGRYSDTPTEGFALRTYGPGYGAANLSAGVPEPTSLALFGLGALGLRRRRRAV